MEQDLAFSTLLAAGASHCAVVVADHGGLLSSLFVTGLLGSLTHCSGMCGPFVLSQVTCRLEAIPARQMREWHRVQGALLVPYHLGRATTYAILGAVAAFMTGFVGSAGVVRWVSAALLIFAALTLIGLALPALSPAFAGRFRWRTIGNTGPSPVAHHLLRWSKPLFAAPTGGRGYLLGVLLGFIPCGLLYGAIAAAASSGDPVAGAFSMVAFAAGTVPSLILVAGLGQWAALRWQTMMRKAAPWLLLFNAIALILLAGQWVL